MAQIQFDASQVEPQGSLEPIPAGWYIGQIQGSEIKPTKDNTGSYIEMQIKVVDGQYNGRMVFLRINVANANPVAVEIGQRILSAVCHATGVIQLQDTQQLHGIPFRLKVSVREDKTGQYEPSNDVKQIKPLNDGEQSAAPTFAPHPYQAAPQQSPVQPYNPAAQKPWQAPPQVQPSFVPPTQQAPTQACSPSAQLPWQMPSHGAVAVVLPPQQQASTSAAPASAPPWARK